MTDTSSIENRYMSNPRLVMSLLMRVLKLDGMVAVSLGQEEPLFDLHVVSLWQDVESGDMARALAVAYLHYAGLDHLNEYHDGNGVLSSVMVRGIKASFDDDKQYNQNVPFKSMQETLMEEYSETKDDLSKIQKRYFCEYDQDFRDTPCDGARRDDAKICKDDTSTA